jgi:hypothetical protein
MAQRGSNNRESLQSRLLERITTKKQKSPEEIYLEEELSSDEEETNQDVDELDEDMETSRKGSHKHTKRNSYDEDADVEDADHLETDHNGRSSVKRPVPKHKSKNPSNMLNSSYKEDSNKRSSD